MTVLRSREIVSPVDSMKLGSSVAPSTPVKEEDVDNLEVMPKTGDSLGLGFSRRRSLRLMGKDCGDSSVEKQSGEVRVSSDKRKKNVSGNGGVVLEDVVVVKKRSRVSDCLGSEIRVSGDSDEEGGNEEVIIDVDELGVSVDDVVIVRDVGESEPLSADKGKGKGKRVSEVGIEITGSESVTVKSEEEIHKISPLSEVENGEKRKNMEIASPWAKRRLSLKGKGKGMRVSDVGIEISGSESLTLGSEKGDDENGKKSKDVEIASSRTQTRFSKEEKGKGKLLDDTVKLEKGICVDTRFDDSVSKESGETLNTPSNEESGNVARRTRRLTRAEKGKGEMSEQDLLKESAEKVDAGKVLEPKVEKVGENAQSNDKADVVARRHHDFARRNASRFAHFSSQVEEENNSTNEGAEISAEEADAKFEDWPGPFSTAWKIIRDRKLNHEFDVKYSKSEIPNPVNWVPKSDDASGRQNRAPSLLDLSMKILIKNVDSIASLQGVPDILRHKLCHMLCDCRKMNSNYLDLLVRDSPTEIRIRDCSWLSEEEFTKAFQECEFQNLMVLQLDQCGRCLPDYTLLSTLAKLPNLLPALTTISLKGACRLSDSGLRSLISSAPLLRSINLSQCSLLTSEGITRLSEVLGSVLRELYLDDCETLDSIQILPALANLECLQVLSLSGIPSVCDDFIVKFVAVRGPNLKELNLTDCTKLTDSSVKVIAKNCTGLCSINLTNIYKLTDSSIGYLANCEAIQTLKLCRNSFSDEAIAAFLETSGASLNNLSLNNVTKVSYNTAISLAKRSTNLVNLDVSFCRNLTDEALGLIVDNCLSLEELKLFGCTQITNVFLNGHSNPNVKIIGLKMRSILEHIKIPELQKSLHYSSVPFST